MEKNEIKEIAKYCALLIILTFVLYRFDKVSVVFLKLINLIFPFLVGGFLALFINVPAKGIDRLIKKISKNKINSKISWIISVILAFLFIIFVLIIVFGSVIPDVSNSLIQAFEQFPDAMNNLSKSIKRIDLTKLKIDENIPQKLEQFLTDSSKQILEWLKNTSGNIFSLSVKLVSDAVFGVINGFIAFVFSIYLLLFKDTLNRQLKKILYAFLSEEKAKITILFGKRLSRNFSNFLSGVGMEAVIYGFLSFILMTILRLPFAASISMINSIVAFIPYFGAFIGTIIGFILIMTQSFKKAVVFIIAVTLLQQFEGNVIYPKVVGNRVGLPSIWVMFSVAIAGSLFGILGMLFAVPTMTFAYTSLRDIVNYRLALKEGKEVKLSDLMIEADKKENL